MARITELRAFLSFFYDLLTRLYPLEKLVHGPEGVTSVRTAETYYPFIREICLTRVVETFDLYVVSILREIFEKRPEMLKSESPIDAATALELRTFEEMVRYLAERKVHELSFRPLSELRKFISSRTGIDLFPTDDAFRDVLLASEVRNLVAHNDCRVNDLFLRRTGLALETLPLLPGRRFLISEEWFAKTSYIFDSLVFDFDAAAAQKFGLECSHEFKSFRVRYDPPQ